MRQNQDFGVCETSFRHLRRDRHAVVRIGVPGIEDREPFVIPPGFQGRPGVHERDVEPVSFPESGGFGDADSLPQPVREPSKVLQGGGATSRAVKQHRREKEE